VNTKQGLPPGRRRRRHSPEFKARLVEECRRPSVSMASVALANGINANLLRRWVVEHEALAAAAPQPPTTPPREEFVSLPLIAGPPPADIRIELRRGATTVTISWPGPAAGECAAWLREWLR
jgi:transposase